MHQSVQEFLEQVKMGEEGSCAVTGPIWWTP